MVVTGLTEALVGVSASVAHAPRVAVVGNGFMGRVHAESARRAGAEIVGVVGSCADRAGDAAAALGAPRGFADIASLLRVSRPEVVHICTPNHTHVELAAVCLAAGAHVVCEKPLAANADDAARLVRAAETAGLLGAVPFIYRYHPMAREMRARISAGEPGVITAVHGGYLQDWMSRRTDDNWRVDAEQGGRSRAFADIGSHWCDFLEFVLGDRIASLSAHTATIQPYRGAGAQRVRTEDVVTMHLRTLDGVLGTAVINQAAAGRKNRLHLEVSGTEASLHFDQEQAERLWLGRREGSQELVRDPETLTAAATQYSRLPAGHPQGYQDCFDAFVAEAYTAASGISAADGLPVFADGLRAARITDAVVASATDGGVWTEVAQ